MDSSARADFAARAPLKRQTMAVFLVTSIIFLSQSKVNCMSLERRKRADNCPRLEVLTSHGCQPCSLCNPEEPNFYRGLIRSGCKEKHPDAIPHYGARKLWCDDPNGPLPECPEIPAAVLRNCSSECNKNNRRFAPDCSCVVGCPDDLGSVVRCTRDLEWSNKNVIPTACLRPTTTTTTAAAATTAAATVAVLEGGHDGESNIGFGAHTHTGNNKDPDQPTQSQGLLWVWVVLAAVAFGAIVAVVVMIAVHFWRKRGMRSSDSSLSSQKTSDSSPDGSCETGDPLLGPEKCYEKGLTATGEGKGSATKAQTMAQPSLSPSMDTSLGSEPDLEIADPVTSVTPATVAVAVAPLLETQTLLRREPEEGVLVKGKNWSQHALQALLNNMGELEKMSLMFDQKDQFDKVTWHTVAKEFALWDNNEIHKRSYMSLPSLSFNPGDGLIYQVLSYLYEETDKGLIELLAYLEKRPHVRHPEAEKFLRTFLDNLEKNVPGKDGLC